MAAPNCAPFVSRGTEPSRGTCHDLNFEASSAGVKTPRSVMMPVIRAAGVMSKRVENAISWHLASFLEFVKG